MENMEFSETMQRQFSSDEWHDQDESIKIAGWFTAT
jgi:hypothetical protein